MTERRTGRPRMAGLDLPWDEDPRALAFIEAHPDGATSSEIAEALGCTRESVRLALRSAIEKLLHGLADRGISADDVRGMMRADPRWHVEPERASRAAPRPREMHGPQSPDVIQWCRMLSNAAERATRAAARIEIERVVSGMDAPEVDHDTSRPASQSARGTRDRRAGTTHAEADR